LASVSMHFKIPPQAQLLRERGALSHYFSNKIKAKWRRVCDWDDRPPAICSLS